MRDDSTQHPPASDLRDTEVEDTAKSRVADAAANEAADALIDHAEADPVRPGEPANAHKKKA